MGSRNPVVPLLALLCLLAATAFADEWRCPRCNTPFPFPSNADAYKKEFKRRHLAVCKEDVGGPGAGGTTGGDMALEAVRPILDAGFRSIGESIAKGLFGDDARKQREEEARVREAERQRRNAETERRRREEEQGRRRALRRKLHDQLLKECHSLDRSGELEPFSLCEENPQPGNTASGPGGTVFFGIGGDGGVRPIRSERVEVDLRDLRHAAFFAQKAYRASPGDARELLQWGIDEANGRKSGVAVDEAALPAVSREEHQAFQQATDRIADAVRVAEAFTRRERETYEQYLLAQQARQALWEELKQIAPGDREAFDRAASQLVAYADLAKRKAEEMRMYARASQMQIGWAEAVQRDTLGVIGLPVGDTAEHQAALAEMKAAWQKQGSDRKNAAGMLLDSVEYGRKDWNRSLDYLHSILLENPENPHVREVISQVEGYRDADGMSGDYAGLKARADTPHVTFSPKQAPQWPGPTRREEANLLDWRHRRTWHVLHALDVGEGDWDRSQRHLEHGIAAGGSSARDHRHAKAYLDALRAQHRHTLDQQK